MRRFGTFQESWGCFGSTFRGVRPASEAVGVAEVANRASPNVDGLGGLRQSAEAAGHHRPGPNPDALSPGDGGSVGWQSIGEHQLVSLAGEVRFVVGVRFDQPGNDPVGVDLARHSKAALSSRSFRPIRTAVTGTTSGADPVHTSPPFFAEGALLRKRFAFEGSGFTGRRRAPSAVGSRAKACPGGQVLRKRDALSLVNGGRGLHGWGLPTRPVGAMTARGQGTSKGDLGSVPSARGSCVDGWGMPDAASSRLRWRRCGRTCFGSGARPFQSPRCRSWRVAQGRLRPPERSVHALLLVLEE